jgi:hypothetical protein
MSQNPAEADIPTAPRSSDGDLATLLRRLGVRFSGVHDYNGGAQSNDRFAGNERGARLLTSPGFRSADPRSADWDQRALWDTAGRYLLRRSGNKLTGRRR